MVMFVSKDAAQASEVLDIWVKMGIEGVTILESAGLSQINHGIRDDVGIFFTLSSLMREHEIQHRTIFSAIRDEAVVNRLVQATTEYVGDWSRPDVGVLFVWPLSQAYGLEKQFSRSARR
jgi:hypothetical protein